MSSWHIQKVIEKYNLYYNPMGNEKIRKKREVSQKKKRITQLKNKKIEGLFFQLDTIVMWWNGVKRYIFTAVEKVSKIGFARMYKNASCLNATDFLNRLWYLTDG
ncbi:MAG: hypothetical protein NC831_06720, partial [Candidatus Omnitrophica bacterium]|nr:hypothetical protein [Candidatus Omnitrophota bacterium]